MKILIISAEFPPFNVGGISLHTYEMCKYLISNEWEVTVLTFHHDTANTKKEYFKMEEICVYRVPRPSKEEIEYQNAFCNQNIEIKKGILELFNEGKKYDLISVHGYFLAEASIYAKDIFKVPVVYHSHTDYGLKEHLCERAASKSDISYVNERLLYVEAKEVIAVSNYLKDLLIQNFGYSEKISVISKGVNLDDYKLNKKDRRQKLNNQIKLIFVGRISQDKGIEVLLDALEVIKRKIRQNILLYVIGTAISKDYLKLIQKKIKEKNLNSNVIFCGYKNQKEILKYYYDADIAVVPSYGETFGKVAIEAMATGVPVIATNVGGLGEIIQHGETGLKFELGNAEELASCIINLSSDYDRYIRMVGNGYNLVSEMYNEKDVLKRTLQVYEKALESEERILG